MTKTVRKLRQTISILNDRGDGGGLDDSAELEEAFRSDCERIRILILRRNLFELVLVPNQGWRRNGGLFEWWIGGRR